jgi:hypothetical protein
MFHAKYLSSSSLSFLKEDFLSFYYTGLGDKLGRKSVFWGHISFICLRILMNLAP